MSEPTEHTVKIQPAMLQPEEVESPMRKPERIKYMQVERIKTLQQRLNCLHQIEIIF